MKKSLAEGWNLEETTFDFSLQKNQKYLYVLNYEYFTNDGTCFSYQFEPCTSREKSMLIKKEKMKEDKYKTNPSKIIKSGKNEWFIEKHEIVF